MDLFRSGDESSFVLRGQAVVVSSKCLMILGLSPMLLERVTEQGIVSSFIDTIEFKPDNWVISSVGLNNTCYNLCVLFGLTAFTPMPPVYTVLSLLRILNYFTMMRRVVLVVEKLK